MSNSNQICLLAKASEVNPLSEEFSLNLTISGSSASGYCTMSQQAVQGPSITFEVSGQVGTVVSGAQTQKSLVLEGRTNIETGGSIGINGGYDGDFENGVTSFDVKMEGEPTESYPDCPTAKVDCK